MNYHEPHCKTIPKYIFLQDNAPSHSARSTAQWMRELEEGDAFGFGEELEEGAQEGDAFDVGEELDEGA